MLCKYPEEACINMTLYHGEMYCDEGFCSLHDEYADINKDMNNMIAKPDLKTEDCLILSFDFSPPNTGDVATLIVAKKNGDTIKVVNEFRNEDALEIYDKLIYD